MEWLRKSLRHGPEYELQDLNYFISLLMFRNFDIGIERDPCDLLSFLNLGVFKSVEVLKILKFIHKLSPSQTKTNFVSILYLVEQNPRTYYKTLSKALCISSKRIEIKSKKVISLAMFIKILDFWGPQNWNIAKILKCPNMKGKMTIIQTL